jgi:broad specificity phosphatase PhoE
MGFRPCANAQYLSRQLNLPIQTVNAIVKIDFGDWTGRTLEDLANDPLWQHFNSFRSGTRILGGETMLEVQHESLNIYESLCNSYSSIIH